MSDGNGQPAPASGPLRADVFKYRDGAADRYADPLCVHRLLYVTFQGRMYQLLGEAGAGADPEPPEGVSPGAWRQARREREAALPAEEREQLRRDRDRARYVGWEAFGRLADGAREVFGLAPFDPATGAGTTDAQAHAVLDAFLDWDEGLKKSTASTPTSPPPTAPPPCPSPASSVTAYG